MHKPPARTSVVASIAGLTLLLAACGTDNSTPPATASLVTLPAQPEPTTAPLDEQSLPPATLAATALPVPQETVLEIAGVELPAGFSLIKYADFFRPTGLAFDDGGRLLATSFDNTLHALADSDGDGRADSDVILARTAATPLGVTVHPQNGAIYLSSIGRIDRLRDANYDGIVEENTPVVVGLPFGRHQNENLKFGPDGLLYMGIGSTCDACRERDARSATIMRFDVSTGNGEVFARGLRNSYDLAFHPLTGNLFATDNGRDDLGDTAPSEELNHIQSGADYGWPACWNDLSQRNCEDTQEALVHFPARSSVNSLDFYTGDRFPPDYRNDLFVAVFGSFLVDVERGIWRVKLTPDGDTFATQVEWFARWPDGWLLGLIEGPDGALYVGDYINGGIYRISYGLP